MLLLHDACTDSCMPIGTGWNSKPDAALGASSGIPRQSQAKVEAMPRISVGCGPKSKDEPQDRVRGTVAQRRGREAEDRSAQWLESKGLQILGRNLRVRGGEIDLLMRDGPTWIFVEVKYRSHRAFGGASASIDWRKQRRVRHAASCLLQERFGCGRWPDCRFDVVLIEEGKLRWIQGAF